MINVAWVLLPFLRLHWHHDDQKLLSGSSDQVTSGQQVLFALHTLWPWPGVRTGERAHPRLGRCPVHVSAHADGATPKGRLDTLAALRPWLLEAGEMGRTPLYQNKPTQERCARKM